MSVAIPYDRVCETSTTTGTGTITLAGAKTGFRAWSTIGDGNQQYYCIEGVNSSNVPTGEWEVGLGTYTLSGTTLARTTVLASSNSGSAVSFSAGTKNVFLTASAPQLSSLPYNVMAFGAKGDGSTDDTTAIQNAINAANTAGGGDIFFPPGTFITTQLTLYSNINVIGSGVNVTILKKKNSSTGDVFQGYNFAALTGNGADKTITNASNATPIVITIASHGYSTGLTVLIGGILGNTAANGTWVIAKIDANTFSLNTSVGNGAYVSGGTASLFDGIHSWGINNLSINGNNANDSNAATTLSASAAVGDTSLSVASTSGFASSGSLILFGNNQIITNASNATPIVITIASHGFSTSDQVYIAGVTGNTAANGTWTITKVDANTFSLNTSVGNGTYNAGTGFCGKVGVTLVGNTPSEVVTYSGTSGGNTFTGVVRAQEGTVAASHASGCKVVQRSTVGYGIRVYAYDYLLQNVHISFCAQDGLYSEWSQTGNVPSPDAMETQILFVKTHQNYGHGVQWKGPHDSNLFGVQSYVNGLNGIHIAPYSGGNQYVSCHSYGGQNYSWYISDLSIMTSCVGEQGWYGQAYINGSNASQTLINGCSFFANTGVYFKGLIINSTSCKIDCIIKDCQAGSIDFTGDGGNNQITATIIQQAGAFYIATANSTTDLMLSPKGTATGATSVPAVALDGPMIVNGNLGVANTTPSTTIGIYLQPQISLASASYDGIQSFILFTTQGANQGTGVKGAAWSNVGTPNTQSGALVGVQGDFYHAGSGTITLGTGLASHTNNASTGVLTAGYGLFINSATNSGGGTFGTMYGVYIDTQTVATKNWAVYTAGTTPSYFNGPVTSNGLSSELAAPVASQTIPANGQSQIFGRAFTINSGIIISLNAGSLLRINI